VAQPNDDISRGQWWTIFQDPQLNALEEQVDVSNQTLAVAEAQLRSARAAIGVARAALFPTVTAGASVSGERQSQNRPGVQNPSSATRADYQLPVDASYEIDVWGRIRHNVEASTASAQASAADLETARLSIHAELAVDYFVLHGLDAQKQLLELTISAFEKALELTTNRYNQGVASQIEVLQARALLEATRAQAIDLGVQRAQFEHAMAILLGKPPAESSPSLRRPLPCSLRLSRPVCPRHCWSAGPTLRPRSGAWQPPTRRSVSPKPLSIPP
jgi:NodT family efflux transporter outer membrane factor (OMF) lipoprotein